MSTHPNVILMAVFTPDDLARKTYRAILADAGLTDDDDNLTVGGEEYNHMVMEGDYDKGFQISAKEGDIVVFDLVTYGYGERKKWADLEAQKASLQEWAAGICERHHCSVEIFVSANYW